MAVTTGTMMAISMGMQMAGQLAQGQAAKKAANAQAQQDEMVAAQVRDQAQAEAERIRKAGERTQGAARAQLAANGVRVDSGSALVIDEEIGLESERDARMTLLTGERKGRALDYSAKQARASGKNAVTSSVLGAAATGSSLMTGWKGVKPADPIGDFYQRGTRGAGD